MAPASALSPAARTRRAFAALAAVSFAIGAVAGGLAAQREWMPASAAGPAPGVRDYQLEIRAADLEVAPGVTWHAWTFNGTVPGPTLVVRAGETLTVTVRNSHTLTHSFHTHLAPYPLEMDGSQINTITGIGAGAMIPPGGQYTYVFRPLQAGVFYYHCHSADGDRMISEHVGQGLYGALLVLGPEEPPVRDEAIFMAEIGSDVTGRGAPPFLMNGKGIYGGERKLEEIFDERGLQGVVDQFGRTLPLVSGKVGEPVRLSLINIGDQIHSFHLHGMSLVSVDLIPGRVHPANVVQLLPGAAERILVTPTEPGVWLFHCHVVSHADMGMIGVFVVEPG
jgi:manganese oxidase